MKKFVIGVSVAAMLAVPALAIQQGAHKGHAGMQGPQTRAQVQAMVQQRFVAMDANKDGAVTQAEFDAHRTAKQAERQSTRAERQGQRFAQLDADKNGQVSRAEFDAKKGERASRTAADGTHHGKGMRGGRRGGGMMGGNWFANMDANKDGRVTLAEASVRPLQMFDRADANKDGTVTPEERKAAWGAMRAESKAKRGS